MRSTAASTLSWETRTSVGRATPAGSPSSTTPVSAVEAGELDEMPSSWAVPRVNDRAGAARARRTTVEPMTASHLRRRTRVAIAAHSRLRVTAGLRRGQFSFGPTVLSRAGTSVSETATLNNGISKPPSPILRRNGIGTRTSAAKDTATVTPLNTTERPAVAIAVRTASSLATPFAVSSRHRVTTSRE